MPSEWGIHVPVETPTCCRGTLRCLNASRKFVTICLCNRLCLLMLQTKIARHFLGASHDIIVSLYPTRSHSGFSVSCLRPSLRLLPSFSSPYRILLTCSGGRWAEQPCYVAA